MDAALDFLRRLYLEPPLRALAWPAVAMVAGTGIAALMGKGSARLGVVPRTWGGLAAIATAPFVHSGTGHLAANLPPFIVLGALVLRRGEGAFIATAAAIALATGLLLWAFARKASHLGMSGVVFGFLGHLLATAWFTRTPDDLLVGGGVLLFYGGMLAGVAPAREGTSWEAHLFGLLAGIGKAWIDNSGP